MGALEATKLERTSGGSAWSSSRVGVVLRRLGREPLVQFLVAGAILAGGATACRSVASPQRIVLDQVRADAIIRAFERDFNRPPTRVEAETLIDRYVRQEILYRQGMAMGLAQDDEIVRRRVVQKAEFILEDQRPPAEPTAQQLEAYFKAHQVDYQLPARVSFSHIFFSPDIGGDADARSRAERADAGDPFPDAMTFEQVSPDQVARLFGRSPFVDAVFGAPVGQWSPPVRSGYGWHRVRVLWRQPELTPPFSQVQPTVRLDYLRWARQRLNEAALDRVAKGFVVQRSYRIGQR